MSNQAFDVERAPDGKMWLCGACGKTAPTRWEFHKNGWDEACMLNAYLVDAPTIEFTGTTAGNNP